MIDRLKESARAGSGLLRRGLPKRLFGPGAYDLVAAAAFVALVALIVLTFRDYAVSNDEGVQQRYGELIVAYYASGFADQSLFHFRDLYLYGGLFDVLAVGVQHLLPLDTYAVRHLISALIGAGGIAMTFATARLIATPRAGLIGAIALSLCGIWYGAMFDHTKDIPFAAAMMAALYLLLRLGRELPRPRWHLVIGFGIATGCALGIRVLGLFLGVYVLAVILSYLPPRSNWRGIIAFVTESALRLLPAAVLAYVIMIAAWPWAALAPFNPIRGLFEFANYHYPIRTILNGHIYHMADVPRWYVPAYVAIKLTLPLLIGATLALVLIPLPVRAGAPSDPERRRETILVAVAALLPLISNVIAHGPGDTGMRHFLFIAPPIAVLAGLGIDATLDGLFAVNRPLAVVVAAALFFALDYNAATLYRLHPDEYLYFNPLVGGLEGAQRRFATDYWVNIMPEAVGDLEHFLDRSAKPAVRQHQEHYLVAVCGEQTSFENAADHRLHFTRNWAEAEFFIAPTHMDCDRALDGKVIATVERLGVVIGVVKDRRALLRRSMASK
jgi:hypothetical protein